LLSDEDAKGSQMMMMMMARREENHHDPEALFSLRSRIRFAVLKRLRDIRGHCAEK